MSTTCPAPARWAAATASDTVVATGTATAGYASEATVRPATASRVRPLVIAAPAPDHRNAPISADHATVKKSTWYPLSRGQPRAHTTTPTAMTRPTQPATIVPRVRDPVTAQTADSRICPPSSGRPGSRLKTPTNALENAAAYSSRAGTVMVGCAWNANQHTTARSRFVSGPTTEMRIPSRGRREVPE
ncbi:hypothetical protein OERS_14750 [Oerskovia enterophila]|uniref:Uncharacterized protein n=1 Tax=Oerskovia enterophila TaxID=43678 RepID=A0ABX2Y5K5_9CELL|nr:hypothetical protein OERS_14750 [Oerskovia enterophila]